MSNFELYNQELETYENTYAENTHEPISDSDSDSESDEIYNCQHTEDTVQVNGIVSCLDCGEELERTIMHEKEWRYYGSADSSRSSDPNRVQLRKSEERNINKDVENMGFSKTIINDANKIYSLATKGEIYRGKSRKAIVFACIFHAYKIASKHQMPKNLMETFNISKKCSLKGLKTVNVNVPKDSKIHTALITPIHLINNIMKKFKCSIHQKKEVALLYKQIKNKSSKLNRSRPQSVAAGLIYYWICDKKIDITLKEFANKADLSELTINKNAKEVALVLGKKSLLP